MVEGNRQMIPKRMGQKTLWGLVVAAGVTLASLSVSLAQDAGPTPIYLDPKRPIEERIDDLMSRMTLKEKVGQLNLPCVYVEQLGRDIPAKMEACRKFTAGTYTQEIGPACGFFTLADEILQRRRPPAGGILQRAAENRPHPDASEDPGSGG